MTRSSAIGALAAIGLPTLVGCASLLGIDEFSDVDAGRGGAGGAGSGVGGQGATVGSEDCLDSVDNNGDRLADCEDPLCAATHQCAPPAPAGWIGIGWVDSSAPFEDCPDDHRLDLYDEAGLQVPLPSCECRCEAPDVSCEALAYCGSNCKGSSPNSAYVGDTCYDLDVITSEPRQCWADGLRATAAGCARQAAVVAPLPTWEPAAVACLYAEPGHCGGAEQCVPRPPGAAEGPCIAIVGDAACPAGYSSSTTYWDGSFADGRACALGGCGCGAPQGMACACTGSPCGMQIFPYGGCAGSSGAVLALGGGCQLTSALSGGGHFVGFRLVGHAVTVAGSCTPTGTPGALTGAVAPSQPITVCCQ